MSDYTPEEREAIGQRLKEGRERAAAAKARTAARRRALPTFARHGVKTT